MTPDERRHTGIVCPSEARVNGPRISVSVCKVAISLGGPGTRVETRTERGVLAELELGRFRLFLKLLAKPKSGNLLAALVGVLGE